MENNTNPTSYNVNGEGKCPFSGATAPKQSAGAGPSNRDWWPNQLKLNINTYKLFVQTFNNVFVFI
jgi:catalase-peroxidase